MHDENTFITLTYEDKHLPAYGSLHLKDFQDFMKRYRKSIAPKKIRFFHCGEYGSKTSRPHYHAIIFGHKFDDEKLFKVQNKIPLYTSATLTNLWGLGHASTGNVTFESTAYVARYITKKITGQGADQVVPGTSLKPYERLDQYGEIQTIKPEYTTMSRRPGIGKSWFDEYGDDIFPADEVIINKNQDYKKYSVPKYYDSLLEHLNPEQIATVKKTRMLSLAFHAENNTSARLAVREKIQKIKAERLIRPL